MNKGNVRTALVFSLRALGTLLIAALFILIFFYVRAPSAARVYATTGALSFVAPVEPEISSRISWPVRNGVLCQAPEQDEFALDDTPTPWNCVEDGARVSGSIWISPSVEVTIRSAGAGVEVYFQPPKDSISATLTFRRRNGELLTASGRAKLTLRSSADDAQAPFVLPIISQSLWVGQAAEWQSLEPHPVLQQGSIALIRESVFGDILFSSERFELFLGDLVQLEASKPDYIQGLVQISSNNFFDVALTASEGDAWLHRLSRDAIRLDAPLAAHFFRDPALIIIGTIFTVVAGLVIGVLQIRPPGRS